MGRPFRVATTTSPMGAVSSNSPATRSVYSWFPTSTTPPGMFTFSPRMAETTSSKARP